MSKLDRFITRSTRTTARATGLALLAALALSPAPSVAQQYPEKPVRIIAPYAGGSASDTLARAMNDQLKQVLGQPFLLDNKAGALGQIAAREVASAPPDGYTLLLALTGTHSINPVTVKQLQYDPIRDFTPVTRLTLGQSIFTVPVSLQVGSIKELVAYARANPGKLSFAAHNAFATFGMEYFRILTGTDMVNVPYKTYADTVSDLLAGRVQVAIMDVLNTTPLIRQGRLRGLAMTGTQKSALNPDLPPVKDVGVPEFVLYSWIGMVGPAALPPAIVQKLNGAVHTAMTSALVSEQLKKIEYYYLPQTPAEFAAFIKEQLQLYSAIAKKAGMQPQ